MPTDIYRIFLDDVVSTLPSATAPFLCRARGTVLSQLGELATRQAQKIMSSSSAYTHITVKDIMLIRFMLKEGKLIDHSEPGTIRYLMMAGTARLVRRRHMARHPMALPQSAVMDFWTRQVDSCFIPSASFILHYCLLERSNTRQGCPPKLPGGPFSNAYLES
nr:hypothetical protein CFP56_52788 [Quercus suber]